MADRLKVGILGAGSWGTALAHLVASGGHSVQLWAYEKEVAEGINRNHQNPVYMSQATLSEKIVAGNDIQEACTGAELLLFVIPAQLTRNILTQIRDFLPSVPLVICSKGIERGSLATMDQVFMEELPGKHHKGICILSGPSFAAEVLKDSPTTVTLACRDEETATRAQTAIATRTFRIYTTTDVTGVELGGALKNVMAIAVGAADGLGLGHNTRAGIITRGLAEISRLAVNMGARPETMLGLAGVGDLILTCTGDLSRNRTVGKYLAEGLTRENILGKMKMIAEGIPTTESAWKLAQKRDVDMPIVEQVYRMLYEGKTVMDSIRALQDRELKQEWRT